jgi:hypothetical protein
MLVAQLRSRSPRALELSVCNSQWLVFTEHVQATSA